MPRMNTVDRDDTLEWLVSALGGTTGGPAQLMLARPGRHQPEMLLPLTNRAAGTAALRRPHDGRSLVERMEMALARAAARTGQLGRIGGDRVVFPATVLVETASEALGQTGLIPAISLGPRRRNRKPVIMLLAPGGRVIAYVKVGWSPLTSDLVDNEERWLRRLDGRLAPPFVAPVPIARIQTGTALAVVTSPLRARWPRRPRPITPADTVRLARSLGSRILRVADLPWLADPQFGDGTDRTEAALRAAVVAVRDRHAHVELETGLWHGDLNAWNRVTVAGGIGVLDWEFAGDDRPVGQDDLHIEFETIRRSARLDPAGIVTRFVERHRTAGGREDRARLDVYLADLAIRESRLSGQGWDGPLAGYRKPLVHALRDHR